MDAALIEHATGLIEQSDALIVAAGAGMGVDSGLPDFRGNAGFWRAYPALGQNRRNFIEVASPRTFIDEPHLAWGFYGHRLQLYRDTLAHAGFGILQRWGTQLLHGTFTMTSNVDGQFQKAGFDPQRVSECHGSIHWLQCVTPCSDQIWSAADLVPDIDEQHCLWLGELPTCPQCGGLARPNIMMFGDSAWIDRRSRSQGQRLHAWLEKTRRPVVVEIGAGTHIPSVRMFSEEVLHSHGGRIVRINPRESVVPTPFDVGLQIGALEGLLAMDRMIDFSASWG